MKGNESYQGCEARGYPKILCFNHDESVFSRPYFHFLCHGKIRTVKPSSYQPLLLTCHDFVVDAEQASQSQKETEHMDSLAYIPRRARAVKLSRCLNSQSLCLSADIPP